MSKKNEIDDLLREKLKVFNEIDKIVSISPSKKSKTDSVPDDKINNIPNFIINNLQYKDNKNSINIKNYNFSNSHDIDFHLNQIQKNTQDIEINKFNIDKLKTILKNKNKENSHASPTKKLTFNDNLHVLKGRKIENNGFLRQSKSLNYTINPLIENLEESNKKEEKISRNMTHSETNQSNNSFNLGMFKNPSFTTLILSESRFTPHSKSHSSKLFTDTNYNRIRENLNCKKIKCQRNKQSSDFIPILNRNSLNIAEKLGSSFDRLTKKKKKSKSINNETFKNLSFISNYSKVSKSSYNLNTLGHSLYNKAVESQIKKKHRINQKSLENELNYQRYSYSPDMSLSKSKSRKRYKSEDVNTKGKIYERQLNWEKHKEKKIKNIKKHLVEKENEQITLKPKLISKNPKNDQRIVAKNKEEILNYTQRINRSNSKKRELKYISEKVINYGKNYTGKRTIVKEFNLSMSNFKSNNRISIDQMKSSLNINELQKLREKFKTIEYFNESKVIKNEKD